MKFLCHTPQNCYLVIWGGGGGATLLYYRGSMSSMWIPMDCLQPWTCIVHGLRRNILKCVPICLFRGTFRNWGNTLPQLLEKWIPLQGERAHSQTPISIQIKSKSNPIHFFALLSSSVSRANLSCVVATIFSSLAFLSSSISMESRSFFVRLHGQTEPIGSCIILQSCSSFFFRFHGQPGVFASNHLLLVFSPTHFHHLASILWEWPGTVSRGLLFLTTFSFPLVIFWLSFLLYLFRVLSSAFLSSVLQSLKLSLL